MLHACVIGASGYTGAEVARLLSSHPHFTLAGTFVSEQSKDANLCISKVHPHLTSKVTGTLAPLTEQSLVQLSEKMDAIFLATPHEASHDWMQTLSSGKAKVFDLSGAFRLKNKTTFAEFYGFKHQFETLLSQAQYGLAEWYPDEISNAAVIAVPGCYPTASLLALKPLFEAGLLDTSVFPIINAVSGVSGAGRKAAMTNSFCEVSLQAYGVLGHRHQPEITDYLGTDVIFTPHLGNFKRGILATITVKTRNGVTDADLGKAYESAYANKPLVRLLDHFPKLQNVVHTPYCDLHWKLDAKNGYVVIGSAIDNLLKGAASQAIQCANLGFGFADTSGLTAETSP